MIGDLNVLFTGRRNQYLKEVVHGGHGLAELSRKHGCVHAALHVAPHLDVHACVSNVCVYGE